MTSVVVAVVAGIFSALAVVLPAVLTSPRRRMLQALAEEQALIAGAADKQTARALRDAHRHSARRYRLWVRVPPQDRWRRAIKPLTVPLFTFSFLGVVIVATLDQDADAVAVYLATALALVPALTAAALSLVPVIQRALDRASQREDALLRMEAYTMRLRRRRARLEAKRLDLIEAEADGGLRDVNDQLAKLDVLDEEHFVRYQQIYHADASRFRRWLLRMWERDRAKSRSVGTSGPV